MKTSFLISLFVALLSLSAAADIRQDLARLYPEQSSETLQKRIEQIESPNDFFRAFTPYFHLRLFQGPFKTSPWNQARHRVGWCFGDPHPNNFGAVLVEQEGSILARAAYLPNDIDDAHPCPQAADILRFLVGWNLLAGEGGTEELLTTYLNVRRGTPPSVTPQVIAMLLREAELRGTRASLKWYQPDLRILRRRADLAAIPSPFDRELIQAVGQVLKGQGRVIQVAERLRVEGGSGGVKRLIALVDRGAEGPLLLEFKEIMRPSTFPWGIPLLDPFLRIKTAWNWQLKDYQSSFKDVVTLYQRPFYTKPMWEGDLSLNLNNLNSFQLREVAHFQASLLGLAHRNGPVDFPVEFETIPAATWVKTVSMMAREIQMAYMEVRGPIERRY